VIKLSRRGRTQRAENFHIIQHHTLFCWGFGEPLQYRQEIIPCLNCVLHELPHHTRVVRVAEPNRIVIIIVIQSKLGKWVLRNPAVGHEGVNDECSPHLLHLHTVRIIRMLPAVRRRNHCFWQASDSVCTTVLTVTLSKNKKPRFARFFCCDVHNKKLYSQNSTLKLENDLETNNKQTNVLDLTMRTLMMHTHTHTHAHTHVVRVCVSVCVYMCVCMRGQVCVGRLVCVWVGGCM